MWTVRAGDSSFLLRSKSNSVIIKSCNEIGDLSKGAYIYSKLKRTNAAGQVNRFRNENGQKLPIIEKFCIALYKGSFKNGYTKIPQYWVLTAYEELLLKKYLSALCNITGIGYQHDNYS